MNIPLVVTQLHPSMKMKLWHGQREMGGQTAAPLNGKDSHDFLREAVTQKITIQKLYELVKDLDSIINGRGDSVTKILKCKDILSSKSIK